MNSHACVRILSSATLREKNDSSRLLAAGANRRHGEVAQETPLVGNLDQAGSASCQRFAHGRAELFGRACSVAGNSESGGEGEKVRVVQVCVKITAAVDPVLDVLDGSVGRIVMHEG